MRLGTFKEFQRRFHCAHMSTDEIERGYYETQKEYNQLERKYNKLKKEYDKLEKELNFHNENKISIKGYMKHSAKQFE